MVMTSGHSDLDTDNPPAGAAPPRRTPNDSVVGGLDPHTAALLDMVNPADDDNPADPSPMTESRSDAPAPPGDVNSSQDSPVKILSPAMSDDAPAMDFQAIVKQRVLDAVRVHADEQPDVEICGVLVGTLYENATAAFVYVDDVIRGDHASGRGTHVTFTADTWQHIDREMEAKHPDKRIVGWYHSHPGFGIFLSEMDLFIQRHFFNAAWQTALVYDPQSKERGLFAWRSGETARVEFVVDDDSGALSARRETPTESLSPSIGPAADPVPALPGSVLDLAQRMQNIEQRQRWILAACGLVALVAIVWPLAVLVFIAPAEKVAPILRSPLPDLSTLPELPPLPESKPKQQRGAPAPPTRPASEIAPAATGEAR